VLVIDCGLTKKDLDEHARIASAACVSRVERSLPLLCLDVSSVRFSPSDGND
jgi:hypothetical protein